MNNINNKFTPLLQNTKLFQPRKHPGLTQMPKDSILEIEEHPGLTQMPKDSILEIEEHPGHRLGIVGKVLLYLNLCVCLLMF